MQPAYDRMQEVAGCSILHAACMQAACRLHYASSVAASIEIHVHIPGVDAVCRAPCTRRRRPAFRGRRPAHRRRRPACRLQAGCMQGVDAKKIRREWTCSFSAYFSERIFRFLAYDSMFRCHRDVICDAPDLHSRRVYCLRLAKNGESAGKLWCPQFY